LIASSAKTGPSAPGGGIPDVDEAEHRALRMTK
jgi:hypothetical protein